jgi:hypothetical protein
MRGVSRSSRTLGAGCGGRGGALDEWRQSGRRSRVVLTPRRWRQVLEKQASQGRRWQESPVTEESAKETVKTIACGNAGCSGATVVTNACAFYHTTRGCGCNGHPAFPTPSVFRGVIFGHTPGAVRVAGMRGRVSSCVLASLRGAERRSNPFFLRRPDGLLRVRSQ